MRTGRRPSRPGPGRKWPPPSRIQVSSSVLLRWRLFAPSVPAGLEPSRALRFDVDRDDLAGPGHRVVLVVAELEGQLVLSRRELRLEHVLAVAEMDPRRRALDDVLA